MRPGLLRVVGDDDIGQLAADLMSAVLKPKSVGAYASHIKLYFEFCAVEGVLPADATPDRIVRYIAWVARRGCHKAKTFGPYLSAINAFLRDHLLEPVALGPFVERVVRGWRLRQYALESPELRVPLPADVALKILRFAAATQDLFPLRAAACVALNFLLCHRGGTSTGCLRGDLTVDGRHITLFRRVVKRGMPDDRVAVLQISVEAHPVLAAVLRRYVRLQAAHCPEATHFWQLPGDEPAAWTADTVTAWLAEACEAVGEEPPAGFVWTSHSLRSGGASAASAAGAPLPSIRWLGGWALGSNVVMDYIVPGIIDTPGGHFFFSFLVPLARQQELDPQLSLLPSV